MKTKTIIALLLLLTATTSAQKIQTETWRTHYAFTYLSRMANAGGTIYGLSEGALMSADQNGEVRTYSKLEGLNDNGIKDIFTIQGTGKLLIAYQNSNIDIIDPDGYIQNINDLSRKTMNAGKQINDIAYKAGRIYMACGFGIATINLNKLEFGDTYMIGQNGTSSSILCVQITGDTIIALADSCLKYGILDGTNLMNHQNWTDIPQPQGKNLKITTYNNTLYLLQTDGTLYKRQTNNHWTKEKTEIADIWSDQYCLYIKRNDGRLSVTGTWNDNKLQGNPTAATCDGKNLWYSMYGGMVSTNMTNGTIRYYSVNAPANNYAWRIKSAGDRIFTVPGGRWAINYFRDGFVSWFNGQWDHRRGDNFNDQFPSHWAFDFVDVEADPLDNQHFWVACYGDGLIEFKNDQFHKLYTCDNSPIETLVPEGETYIYQRVDGLKYDNQNRLWLTNRGKAQIKCIDPDGTWHLLSHTGLSNAGTLQDIIIDQNTPTRKYILCPRYTSSSDSYLFVFDDKNTLDDITDDQTRGFTYMTDQDGKTIYFNQHMLRSIAQDKNGLIWIGTTEGLFTLPSRAKIFDSNFRCNRIKISRNDGSGLADYLLGTETINAIAIDGGNRKWFGTENGAYLISADGQQTIHHFTTENSPLLSNSVTAIGISQTTGEVFLATGNGLISYQSDAVQASDDYSTIHAYPNPVRPDYDGVITITGLMQGSHVKICDINGRTIYETTSNGGTATWDRGDAPSGIYFAVCFDDNKHKGTCKILILKQQ